MPNRVVVAAVSAAALVVAGAAVAGIDPVSAASPAPLVQDPVESVTTTWEPGALTPAVVVDAAGAATAVWTGSDHVRSATRNLDGVWTAPETVPCAGRATACSGDGLRLGVDGAGTVWAVWAVPVTDMSRRIWTTHRPAGGDWRDARPLSARFRQEQLNPELQLAVSGNGAVVVVWGVDSAPPRVMAAYRPEGEAWQAPVRLSAKGELPDVAIDAKGRALALFVRPRRTLTARRFTPGPGWGAGTVIGHAYAGHVALGPRGHAIACWLNGPGSGDFGPSWVMVREMSRTGSWRPVTRLSSREAFSGPAACLIDSAGTRVASWPRETQVWPRQAMVVDRKSVGGAWTKSVVGLAFGDRDYELVRPTLHVNAHNDLAAQFMPRLVLRPATGSWSAPTTVRVGKFRSLTQDTAVLPNGAALHVWSLWKDTTEPPPYGQVRARVIHLG